MDPATTTGTANSSGWTTIDYEAIIREFYQNVSRHEDTANYPRALLSYYIMGIGGMVVCCFGLIGNMLSLVVLTRKSMRSSTYTYLSSLAVCDSLVLMFTMILLVKDVDKPIKGQNKWAWDEGIYPYLFPYIHPAAFMFQVASIWLTLAFTVDRYIMICHPFKAEPFCTISRARKVVASLYVTAILFNIPKFFEYVTVPVAIPSSIFNKTTYKIGCDLTEFGKSHVFRELYHSWFYIVFVCGVPFLSLAVLNSFLMHSVRLSRKRGKEINAAEKKRNDTTIMLIGVVVIFFICQMPALVSRTIWAFETDPQDKFRQLPLYTLNEVGNFLIIINSAINIVPYYLFGRKFRREFWKLFCKCLLNYDRFRKMSRSFSLTALDTHRISNGSLRNVINHERKMSQTSGQVNPGSKQSHLLMVHQPKSCPGRSLDESYSDLPKNLSSGFYQAMHTNEVNSNCEDPNGVTCQLLQVKSKVNGIEDLEAREEENQL